MFSVKIENSDLGLKLDFAVNHVVDQAFKTDNLIRIVLNTFYNSFGSCVMVFWFIIRVLHHLAPQHVV